MSKIVSHFCYKVRVKTTNALKTTTQFANGKYAKCDDEIVYVAAESFAEIEQIFGTNLLMAEYIGPCYRLERGEP